MKFMRNGGPAKLVAFFLIAVALLCTVGFAAGGWQSIIDDEPDSGDADGDDKSQTDGDADENTDGENPDPDGDGMTEENLPAVKPVPEYIDYLTGMEITQEESFIKYSCFVLNTDAPLYGISSSAVTVEMPTENGKTRFIAFKKDAVATGKIGSIAPTRDYISIIASFFNGILVSNGCDDSFDYSFSDYKYEHLDFSCNLGYHYTEYTEFIYTNGDLINAFIKNSGISPVKTGVTALPYNFVGYYDDNVSSAQKGTNVIISYDEGNSTELTYSADAGRYILAKNGTVKTDLLTDKALEYDNAFILYADSTTYETKNCTETVLSTDGSGEGYYLTRGTVQKILWSVGTDGQLVFTDENGEKLTVNRGTSYISYVKSSQIDSVKIS